MTERFFGEDALGRAASWLDGAGAKRPLLVCGPSRRFVPEVAARLGNGVHVFDGAQVHVPRAAVDACRAAAAGHGADALVTVGGGSATGMGKALRLELDVPFVAVPTTYSGSEMTRIFGITDGGEKQTGRDDRVRPNVAVYVPAFLRALPPALTVQSLMNALAHPIAARDRGPVIERLFRAVLSVAEGRTVGDIARWASDAAAILDDAELGLHHAVAHRLGGRFGLPHAALHAVLLPHSLDLDLEREVALPETDPPAALFDALTLVGAPTSVVALGVDADEAIAAAADLDAPWIEAAVRGHRPSRLVARSPEAAVVGDLASARAVVLAASDAGLTEARAVIGDAAGVAVVAGPSPAWVEARAPSARLHVFEDAVPVPALRRIELREQWVGPRAFQRGFGNALESEALPGALPAAQNAPRRAPYGLQAEQLNGTGFVAARDQNQRTWMYRLRPSAGRRPFAPISHATFVEAFDHPPEINLTGHEPLPIPDTSTDFIDGLHTYGGQGKAVLRRGFAIHLYAANRSMDHRSFYDADGDLMILPQEGDLVVKTELGSLDVSPGHLVVIPRGLKFSVLLRTQSARGFVGEVFDRHFELPDRGVVGANGLADPRHFVIPCAAFEDRLDPGHRLTAKLGGTLHETTLDRSPYDVVAWHGNYTPYAYDLSLFSPIGNVAVDHPDPSVHLVLCAPLDERGADSLDLVIFPPRWDPTEHSFRPPFHHRNAITEWNAILKEGGDGQFRSGRHFLTPCLTPHAIQADRVELEIESGTDEPSHVGTGGLWFQFETALPLTLTPWARDTNLRIQNWQEVWGRYRSYYDPTRREN